MMKKLLFLCIFSISPIANAQKVSFGATGGTILGFASGKAPGLPTQKENRTGMYGGLYAEFKLTNTLRFTPSLGFSTKEDNTAFLFPVVFKYYTSKKFNLQAGGHLFWDISKTPQFNVDYYNRLGISITGGAGYDINKRVFIEARYLYQINDHVKNLPDGFSLKANFITSGVGYRF